VLDGMLNFIPPYVDIHVSVVFVDERIKFSFFVIEVEIPFSTFVCGETSSFIPFSVTALSCSSAMKVELSPLFSLDVLPSLSIVTNSLSVSVSARVSMRQ